MEDKVLPYRNFEYLQQLRKKHRFVCKRIEDLRKKLKQNKQNMSKLLWVPRWKEDICPVRGIVASPTLTQYRNKESYTIGFDETGKHVSVGFNVGKFIDGYTNVAHAYVLPKNSIDNDNNNIQSQNQNQIQGFF